MRRSERLVVYPLTAILASAAIGRLGAARADGPADATYGVLTVRAVKVVDADGKVLLTLGTDGKGGTVSLRAARDEGGLDLSVNEHGGQFSALNVKGKKIAYAGAAEDADVGMVIVNGLGGQRRAALVGREDGGAAEFHNVEGTMVLYTGAASDARGLVFGSDKSGERAFQFGAGPAGGYAVWLNTDKKQAAFAGASEEGAGVFRANQRSGEKGKTLAP